MHNQRPFELANSPLFSWFLFHDYRRLSSRPFSHGQSKMMYKLFHILLFEVKTQWRFLHWLSNQSLWKEIQIPNTRIEHTLYCLWTHVVQESQSEMCSEGYKNQWRRVPKHSRCIIWEVHSLSLHSQNSQLHFDTSRQLTNTENHGIKNI